METWEENIRYAANADGLTHTKTADLYGRMKCLNCGEICAELKALSAQEQVLVTFKSAGLDEVVEAAMSAMKVRLSGEAESLMDKVDARMGTMTAGERTAYEDRLAEYFPVTERIIAGARVRTFTIDMRVVVDGYARVERYQFYLDENGEWIFERVDLASFGRL